MQQDIGAEVFYLGSLGADDLLRLCRRGCSHVDVNHSFMLGGTTQWLVLYKEGSKRARVCDVRSVPTHVQIRSADDLIDEELDLALIVDRLRLGFG